MHNNVELPSELNLLIAWVIIGAIALVVHGITLREAFRFVDKHSYRIAALIVPPLAPYLAWRGGARFLSFLWVTVVVVYAIARLGCQ